MTPLARGPVFIGVEGLELSPADRERLVHPLVGGVILFSAKFQVAATIEGADTRNRSLRTPGSSSPSITKGAACSGFATASASSRRCARWASSGTAMSPVRRAKRCDRSHHRRRARAHGVDFSFTPVLDVDHGESAVIGNRAFHRNPNAIAHLASALCDGLHAGGMAAVGKHFPGHGHVAADSHTELPVDDRPLAAIVADDLVPFGALIARGLEAIMPAHVVYSAIDKDPPGFRRNGCRRSCADDWASTASSFPTISAWQARKVSAISSPARKRPSLRGATWCWPATISRRRHVARDVAPGNRARACTADRQDGIALRRVVGKPRHAEFLTKGSCTQR
jgi:beta-glucosidase-like glycosyl hydrolase